MVLCCFLLLLGFLYFILRIRVNNMDGETANIIAFGLMKTFLVPLPFLYVMWWFKQLIS